MGKQGEWMTATEAREQLGVSRGKFVQLVKSGALTQTPSALDGRIKLVKRAEVERLMGQPRAKKQVA